MQLEDINVQRRNAVFSAYQALLFAARQIVREDCKSAEFPEVKMKYDSDYFYSTAFRADKRAQLRFPDVMPKREKLNPYELQTESLAALERELDRRYTV